MRRAGAPVRSGLTSTSGTGRATTTQGSPSFGYDRAIRRRGRGGAGPADSWSAPVGERMMRRSRNPRGRLEAALSAARTVGDVRAEAYASSFLGWDLYFLGDPGQGYPLGQTALWLHQQSADQIGVVLALAGGRADRCGRCGALGCGSGRGDRRHGGSSLGRDGQTARAAEPPGPAPPACAPRGWQPVSPARWWAFHGAPSLGGEVSAKPECSGRTVLGAPDFRPISGLRPCAGVMQPA